METLRDLRFAVLGWGYWAPKVARNLESMAHASVTMVADIDPYRLASLHRDKPWIQTTTNPAEVFAADVDAVVIATPVKVHYQLARQALESGKHVLVEKPLAASVAEAEDLVALARVNGRVLMVGHTFEYSPAVNELRKLIRDGELGRIYCIETERLNLGLFRNDIDVLWDLAPHDISILLYLLGQQPLEARAHARAHLRAEIFDVAHLDLTFADSLSAHVHVSWLHPCKIRRVTVMGDARMAVYDDTNPAEALRIFNKGAEVTADPTVSYRYGAITIPHIEWVEPLRLECEDFANAIRTGASPRANGDAGLQVVKVLESAHEWLAEHDDSNRLRMRQRKTVQIPA